jgi:hypothetical protein
VIKQPLFGAEKNFSSDSGNRLCEITVKSDVVDKNLATVTVTKPGPGIVQGGLFWQYYEDLDKIKSSENYISVTKELYKK